MTQSEITQLLIDAANGNPKAAIAAASEFLHRANITDAQGVTRIVDPATGQYQRHFMANGNRYTILDAGEPICLTRQNMIRKMCALIGFDLSLPSMRQDLEAMKADIDRFHATKTGIFDLTIKVGSMLDRVTNLGEAKDWTPSLWACAGFIIREGEDISKYDQTQAEEKIKDWDVSNLFLYDFFFLALRWEQRWNELSNVSLLHLR